MSALLVADSVLPHKAVAQTPPLRHSADLHEANPSFRSSWYPRFNETLAL